MIDVQSGSNAATPEMLYIEPKVMRLPWDTPSLDGNGRRRPNGKALDLRFPHPKGEGRGKIRYGIIPASITLRTEDGEGNDCIA